MKLQAPELLEFADEQQARVAVADKLLRSLDATWLLARWCLATAAAVAAAASIASTLGVGHEFVASDLRIFELIEDAGQALAHTTESFSARFSRFVHVLTSVQFVTEAARPRRVVVIDHASIESSAAATCAALLGIPVACLLPDRRA